MGNTVHRTLPGTRGAAPRGGAERLVLSGQPQPRSPGCTLESGCLSLMPGAAPQTGRADPAWFSWPWPCALRLCYSRRSLRSKPGAIGVFPGRSLQRVLRVAGVPGPRAQPAGAPTTRATSWRRSHARPTAPSSGVRSAGGSPAPSEPLLRSASPPS